MLVTEMETGRGLFGAGGVGSGTLCLQPKATQGRNEDQERFVCSLGVPSACVQASGGGDLAAL